MNTKGKINNYTKLTKNNLAINTQYKENSNINLYFTNPNNLNNEIFTDSSFAKTESNNNSKYEKEDQITQKIDYKHYTNYPIENLISNTDNNYEKIDSNIKNKKKIYWLAVYDKYIKKKNLLKIFNFYKMSLELEPSFFDNIKLSIEKTMIIKDFQLIFMKNYNKTFVIPSKGSQIFVKLYLLNIEQMNMIYSYINRIEFKPYLNDIIYNNNYNCYEIVNNEIKKNLTYSSINCLGSYMNIDIFTFSTLNYLKEYNNKILRIKNNKVEEEEILNEDNNNSLPSTKKIAKLIKILMINFPDYSKDYLINYLFNSFSSKNESSQNKDNNIRLSEKIIEVNNLLMTKRKSIYQHKDYMKTNSNTNEIIKNIISSIPTNSMSPIETNNKQNGENMSCSEFISDSKYIFNVNGNTQNNTKNSQNNSKNKNNNILLSYSSIQKNDLFLNNPTNSINKFMITSKEKEKKVTSKKSMKSFDSNNNEKLLENKLYRNIKKTNGLILKNKKGQKSALPMKCKKKLKINININNCSYVKKDTKDKDKNLEIYIDDIKKGDEKIQWKKYKTKTYLSLKKKKITRNSYVALNTNNIFPDFNKDDNNTNKKYVTINTENNKVKSYHIYHNKIPKINKSKNNVGKKRKEIKEQNNLTLIEKKSSKNKNMSVNNNNNNKQFEKPKKYEMINIDPIRTSLNYSIQKTGSTKNSISSLNKKGRFETPKKIKNFRYYN